MWKWFVIVVLVALFAGTVAAQEDVKPPADVVKLPAEEIATTDVLPSLEPLTLSPADNAEKKKKAMAALSAVAGIAIFGVGAIAVTVLWRVDCVDWPAIRDRGRKRPEMISGS